MSSLQCHLNDDLCSCVLFFPLIIKWQGSGQVKERETGAEVYRIQVSDLDTPGSSSWLAKFTLYGEKAENFNLKTNPDNNEGILYVVKVKLFYFFFNLLIFF